MFIQIEQDITMDHILPWLILKNVSGVGNHLFKRLIDRFQSPETILKQSAKELESTGIPKRVAQAICTTRPTEEMKNEIHRAKQFNINIVCMHDENYPPLLRQIHDPPPILYVYGQLINTDSCVAVVGSRNSTTYGESFTRSLSRELAENQLTIVSGMARGIDTAAHKGALDANGRTIAVMGCGLETVYPAENKKLFHRIAKNNGAIISEFPMRAMPEAYHFPQRNRIISGMSMGTIVVEAGSKSGSLITARLALEQDRQVFAVPGQVNSQMTDGTHRLIKQGAKLIENAQDVLEDLGPFLNYHLHHPTKKYMKKNCRP
ncbi:MAG: DNA processing protein [Candidatus Magnetoglobus multicellularis str. Araruama]|uniref:DNA processing protein n=1 Tax=Candidatus Magnetoglobus multicellularis str. Araruama TaxID=890399 RepID=A0A1V1P9Y3_9BACT|nr:MAG: DNA processing protein [Candidatus Magnetoglobus multicellularis str. Araruama]